MGDRIRMIEDEVQTWQEKFEVYHGTSAESNREAHGIRVRIEVLDERMSATAARVEELGGKTGQVATQSLEEAVTELSGKIAKAASQERDQQASFKTARSKLAEERVALQQIREREGELQRSLNSVTARLEALRRDRPSARVD